MKTKQTLIFRVVFSSLAVLVAVLYNWLGPFSLDTTTVTLLVIAALPWLSFLVKSIEIPGIGKFELQDKIDEAIGAAESYSKMSAFVASESISKEEDSSRFAANAEEELKKLCMEYDEIRRSQSPGDMRTVNMTRVLRQMVDLIPTVRGFDIRKALGSSERGVRLSGYAYLYAKPDFDFLEAIVCSVTEVEDKPFGQYWGLKSIYQVLIQKGGKGIPGRVRRMLGQFSARIKSGTDRDYELRRIFRVIESEED